MSRYTVILDTRRRVAASVGVMNRSSLPTKISQGRFRITTRGTRGYPPPCSDGFALDGVPPCLIRGSRDEEPDRKEEIGPLLPRNDHSSDRVSERAIDARGEVVIERHRRDEQSIGIPNRDCGVIDVGYRDRCDPSRRCRASESVVRHDQVRRHLVQDRIHRPRLVGVNKRPPDTEHGDSIEVPEQPRRSLMSTSGWRIEANVLVRLEDRRSAHRDCGRDPGVPGRQRRRVPRREQHALAPGRSELQTLPHRDELINRSVGVDNAGTVGVGKVGGTTAQVRHRRQDACRVTASSTETEGLVRVVVRQGSCVSDGIAAKRGRVPADSVIEQMRTQDITVEWKHARDSRAALYDGSMDQWRIGPLMWGSLFVWIGIMLVIDEEPGAASIGAGVILIIGALWRRMVGRRAGFLTSASGILLVLLGLGDRNGDQDGIPLFATTLIAIGALIISKSVSLSRAMKRHDVTIEVSRRRPFDDEND